MKFEFMLSSHSSLCYVVLAFDVETLHLSLLLTLLTDIQFFFVLEYFLLSLVPDE